MAALFIVVLQLMHFPNKFYFIPALIWFAASLYLFIMPGTELPKVNVQFIDKIAHVVIFFVLVALITWPFLFSETENRIKKKWFLGITLISILYGIVIEFVQENLVQNRSFDIVDMVADAIGSLLAFLLSVKYFTKHHSSYKKIGPDRNRDRNQN